MAKLAELLVSLKADTADLRKGLDEMRRELDKTKEHTKGILDGVKAIGQQMTLSLAKDAVAALGEFVAHGAEAADKMGKLAQAAGQPVEEFSKLAYAASLSDVSTEQLGVAMNHLNKAMAAAGAGSAEQARLFHALGISIKDSQGNLRDSGAVFKDLAEAFKGLPDGASKSALAMEVFGKTGADLIPLLNAGEQGLAAMAAEAERFGVVVTEQAAASAEAFNDDLTRLHKAVEGVQIQVAAELTPALGRLTDHLLKSSEGADVLKGAVLGISVVAKVVLSAVTVLGSVFEVVGKQIGAFASIVYDLLQGNFQRAFEGAKESLGGIDAILGAASGAIERIGDIWAEGPVKGPEKAAEATKKSADKIYASLKPPIDRTKELAAAFKKVEEQLERINKLKIEAEGDVDRAAAAAGREAARRTFEFSNVGKAPGDLAAAQFAEITNGFRDFKDALEKATTAAIDKVRYEGAAKVAAEEHTEAGYRAAEGFKSLAASADATAKSAYAAADAYTEAARRSAEETERFWQETWEKVGQAIRSGVGQLNGMLGDAGQLANSAIQGFATGGWYGALINVILDLLSKFRRWGEVLDKAQGAFEKLMNDVDSGLSEIVDMFLNLIDVVQPLANLIHGVLNPILEIIATLFNGIATTLQLLIAILDPVLTLLGDALGGIADLLKTIFEPLSACMEVLKPIVKLFGDLAKVLVPLAPIFAIIGFVLKLVALVLLAIMNAVGTIINAVAKAFGAKDDVVDVTSIRKQMETVANSLGDSFGQTTATIDDGSKKVAGAFDTAAGRIAGSGPGGQLTRDEFFQSESDKFWAGLRGALPTEDEWKQYLIDSNPNRTMDADEWAKYQELNPGGFKTYQEYLESLPFYVKPVNEALDDMKKNVDKVNESFSNVPSGYKLALARFNSTVGDSGRFAETGRDNSGINMRGVNIYITATENLTPEKLWEKLKSGVERAAFRATGSAQAGQLLQEPARP